MTEVRVRARIDFGVAALGSVAADLVARWQRNSWVFVVESISLDVSLDFGGFKLRGALDWKEGNQVNQGLPPGTGAPSELTFDGWFPVGGGPGELYCWWFGTASAQAQETGHARRRFFRQQVPRSIEPDAPSSSEPSSRTLRTTTWTRLSRGTAPGRLRDSRPKSKPSSHRGSSSSGRGTNGWKEPVTTCRSSALNSIERMAEYVARALGQGAVDEPA